MPYGPGGFNHGGGYTQRLAWGGAGKGTEEMRFTRRIFEEQLERAAQKAESNKHESCYLRRGPGIIWYSTWRFEAAINEMDGGYIYTVRYEPTGEKSSGYTTVRAAVDACMKMRKEYEKKRKEEQCHSAGK